MKKMVCLDWLVCQPAFPCGHRSPHERDHGCGPGTYCTRNDPFAVKGNEHRRMTSHRPCVEVEVEENDMCCLDPVHP